MVSKVVESDAITPMFKTKRLESVVIGLEEVIIQKQRCRPYESSLTVDSYRLEVRLLKVERISFKVATEASFLHQNNTSRLIGSRLKMSSL